SLAEINVESLAEYGFFTYLKVGEEETPLLPPTSYGLTFDGRQLTLTYVLPLAQPVAVGQNTLLEVFDAQYFVAFAFPKESPATLIGAPEGCSASHHAPEEMDASMMNVLSQIPMDQRTLPSDLAEATKSLANYIVFDCPGAVRAGLSAAAVPWPIKSDGDVQASSEAETSSGFGFGGLLFIPFAILGGGVLLVLARRLQWRP
ncbi:MAG: DUF1007 family protein, partial [Rhizobiales bacterium]|nr:DUF1007 family protein [Hyphomicrobiales bacterium]